jgi:hypothetical protein
MGRRVAVLVPAIAFAIGAAVSCGTAPPPAPESVTRADAGPTTPPPPTTPTATTPHTDESVASPPAAPGRLAVDGLARVDASDGVRMWADPRARKRDRLDHVVPDRSVVFIADGPRVVDGKTWWAIASEAGPGGYGWVSADDEDRPALVPYAPECSGTTAPLEAPALRALGTLQALACFGDREIALRGDVTCLSATIDYAVGGAGWLDAYAACSLDEVLALNGPAATSLLAGQVPPANPVHGRFEVRGHFDDPQARACFRIGLGAFVSSPIASPEPEAVMACRLMFVATSVVPLP